MCVCQEKTTLTNPSTQHTLLWLDFRFGGFGWPSDSLSENESGVAGLGALAFASSARGGAGGGEASAARFLRASSFWGANPDLFLLDPQTNDTRELNSRSRISLGS